MTLETANRLYELRKKHNLSQEELAEKLGVSRQAVSKWERSEASPDTDNLIALAKIYGLSLDELIYGYEKEKNDTAEDEASTEKTDEDNVFINIEDDGGDRVKISHDGIVVEEKSGNTVRINVGGKIMEKVIEKIEDEIDDCDCAFVDGDKTVFVDGDKTVFVDEDGHISIQVDKKERKSKFWIDIAVYPIICVIAYMIFGFYNICGGWGRSWLIFVTIPVFYSIFDAIHKRRFGEFAYPVLATCIYLYLGLYQGNWHPSWLIFLTIPVYSIVASSIDNRIKKYK